MTQNEVFSAVVKLVADRTECDPETVKPESTFQDLGIDSLDTVELLMNLEDELGVTIELDRKVSTVNDLVEFILANN